MVNPSHVVPVLAKADVASVRATPTPHRSLCRMPDHRMSQLNQVPVDTEVQSGPRTRGYVPPGDTEMGLGIRIVVSPIPFTLHGTSAKAAGL